MDAIPGMVQAVAGRFYGTAVPAETASGGTLRKLYTYTEQMEQKKRLTICVGYATIGKQPLRGSVFRNRKTCSEQRGTGGLFHFFDPKTPVVIDFFV